MSKSTDTIYDFLRKISFFADLSNEDMGQLCHMVAEIHLSPGEELFTEGSMGDLAYVIESGEVEIIKTSGQRPILLAVRKRGDVIGEMALIVAGPRIATARAHTATKLIAVSNEQFDRLLNSSATASRVLLRTVLERWRTTTAAIRQSEKMVQLGTLTAGVAHELNNPAAAVQRSAGQMRDALSALHQVQAQIGRLVFSESQQASLAALDEQLRTTAGKFSMPLNTLARSDLESELEQWLDEQGVPYAWELAPTLADLGYDVAGMISLAAHFAPQQLPAILGWLSASYNVHLLLTEIEHGGSRISTIVNALKAYSYLDQAPVQTLDIHEGLESTLFILGNKLAGITVRREYAPNLPKIQGYGSELNQAWTNLLDNAADALAGATGPEIVIQTAHHDDWVTVRIQDNGPGIPPEIQSRIFDAFFTTKPPGKGTGLGLDITYRIIVNKQRGNLRVSSRPGETCFQIDLPKNFEDVSPPS